MSRNPHAANLRHYKPKRIEDRREALYAKYDVTLGSACVFYDLGISCHKEGCALCSTDTSAT